jgi:outer membrane protein assembly factor BamA
VTRSVLAVTVAALVSATTVARAQPDPAPDPAPVPPAVVPPSPPAAPEEGGPRWSEWRIQGTLLEPEATVRAMLATTMNAHATLGPTARAAISQAAEVIGYHLIGLGTATVGGKVVAILSLAPIPVVRSVVVDVDQGLVDVLTGSPLLDDQVAKRLRIRVGARLPWDPQLRANALRDETRRIEGYLHDEGFFDAKVVLSPTPSGTYGIRIDVDVEIGAEYKIDKDRVTIETGGGQGVAPAEIKAQFSQQKECLVWRLCFGKARFTRARHAAALLRVTELYRRRGFPAVRVQSDFDPKTSFDRRTKTVRFTVRVDERREIDVVFEGNDKSRFPDDVLRKQLTFDEAASSDDFEAASSAAALVAYYQSKSNFDAQVTVDRVRFTAFDRIVFRIDEGDTRQVRSVSFLGNHAIATNVLADVVTIRVYRAIRILGTNPTLTATVLTEDADRVRRTYAERGFLAARVDVHASPDRETLGSAALTGSVLAAGRKNKDLHVRFDILEGPRTDVAEIRIEVLHDDGSPNPSEVLTAEACDAMLDQLAKTLGTKPTARRVLAAGDCAATLTDVAFEDEKLRSAGDGLRDYLWAQGRPRSGVELQVDAASVKQHRAVLVYKVALGAVRQLGTVVVRGNFRTRRSVILGELGFKPGAAVTSGMLAQGPRAVRSTGLFEAVNVELLNLDADKEVPVDAVIRVEERYDRRAQVDTEGGYSSQNGVFAKIKPALPNMFGLGIYTDVAVTYGSKYYALEVSSRIPRWLARRVSPVSFDTELTGYLRSQDTPRFGRLTTQGASIGLTRSWQRPASEKQTPYLIATSLRYDFRLRNRDEDALRPAGVDADQDKVPVATRTGSLGISLRYDTRADHRGQYNPLAAEKGGLLEASVSFASPYLLGQDTFVKASLMAQRFVPIGQRVVIRGDIRVDEGFPLGNSVLLPEVERFFAGGDNTVRGFDEDRLATEIIETGVPPLDGLRQIRVLPAGGNIRAVASIDGQLILVGRWLATALFVDAGMVRNRWTGIEKNDIRPGVGAALRILTPFGTITVEYAFPVFPHLGDDPSGRIHFGLAFRQ